MWWCGVDGTGVMGRDQVGWGEVEWGASALWQAEPWSLSFGQSGFSGPTCLSSHSAPRSPRDGAPAGLPPACKMA